VVDIKSNKSCVAAEGDIVHSTADEHWMQQALALAECAASQGEVPVGAVAVCNGDIVGRGWNRPIQSCDPTAHAEIIALREAAQTVRNYRLINTTLYVTLEPCTMCVGAMIHARIERLVFGATEPKSGAVVSQFQLSSADYFNHTMDVCGGVLQEASQRQLSDFFKARRALKA